MLLKHWVLLLFMGFLCWPGDISQLKHKVYFFKYELYVGYKLILKPIDYLDFLLYYENVVLVLLKMKGFYYEAKD
jgi:hypothetical protein